MADFSRDGVELHLGKIEYDFLMLTLSYVLHGVRLADHDFANILGMSRENAEIFLNGLNVAERAARDRGDHWNPLRHPG
jgi:hypothetical protein